MGRPSRTQKKWGKLNLACKVVITAGFRFSAAKGILSAFFLLCPPVCRTYLLTDPDEPEESATMFEPSTATTWPEDEEAEEEKEISHQNEISRISHGNMVQHNTSLTS